MAVADTARLIATLELDDKFTAAAKKAGAAVGELEGKVGRMGGAILKSRAVAVSLGVGIERLAEKGISTLGDAIGDGIRSLEELERVNQQTAAAIKSTGGASGQTVESIRALAEAQEDLTTVDDKVIQSGENVLLRYTSLGKEVFPRATAAAVNMAVALANGDTSAANVASTAALLGKALEDPVKSLGALRKAGIVFTDAEEDAIKAMAKANDIAGAQGLILQALEKRYGEAGKAASEGFGGDVRRFRDAVEDAQQALARGLLPALQSVARFLTTRLKDPDTIRFMENLGKSLGEALDAAVAFAQRVPWAAIGNSLRIAGEGAKAVLDAFVSLPAWVQTAVITGWGLNKLTGGGLTDLLGSVTGGIAKSLAGTAINFFAGRGSNPANPLFVLDVTGGGKEGGIVKTVVEAFKSSAIVTGIVAAVKSGIALLALPAFVLAQPFLQAGDTAPTAAALEAQGRTTDAIRELEHSLKNALDRNDQVAAERIRGEIAALRRVEEAQKAGAGSLEEHIGKLSDDTQRAGDAITRGLGKATDDLTTIAGGVNVLGTKLDAIHQDFLVQRGILRTSNDPQAIADAAAAITRDIVKGVGNTQNTADVLETLRAQRAEAVKRGDRQLVKLLDRDIDLVAGKLANRQFVDKQLAALARIESDGKVTADETAQLRAIQADLKAHGDTQAAGIIQRAIDGSKTATTAAIDATTQAIKDKDLSVTVNFPGKAADDRVLPQTSGKAVDDTVLTKLPTGKEIDDIVRRNLLPFTTKLPASGTKPSGKELDDNITIRPWRFIPTVKLDPSQVRDLRTEGVVAALGKYDDRDRARIWRQTQAINLVKRSMDQDRKESVAASRLAAAVIKVQLAEVGRSIDADRRDSVAAANAATNAIRGTTEAVKDKDLSLTANFTAIVTVPVSLYSITKAQKLKSRLTGRIGGP